MKMPTARGKRRAAFARTACFRWFTLRRKQSGGALLNLYTLDNTRRTVSGVHPQAAAPHQLAAQRRPALCRGGALSGLLRVGTLLAREGLSDYPSVRRPLCGGSKLLRAQ
jgi:hypothetical protein